MNFNISDQFKRKIIEKHKSTQVFPSTSDIVKFVSNLILLLFPEQSCFRVESIEQVESQIEANYHDLCKLLKYCEMDLNDQPSKVASKFMERLPQIYEWLLSDIISILNGDPAAKSEFEVVRTYPGFYAIAFYRIAHELYQMHVPLIPRIITEYAHSKTGIDIHPGAKIAPSFFIDHGTGITIGETTIIGENVKLYQGVTLGALSVSKKMANQKRHPTIENDVVIYSGATILGGDTVVGHHSIIGGNVWLTHSVPPYSKVYHREEMEFKVDDKKSNPHS